MPLSFLHLTLFTNNNRFNILVIVALSAAVAGKSGASLQIDYRPVGRDVCFYTLSILLLAIFFDDGYEAGERSDEL